MVKRKDGLWQEKVLFNGKYKYFYGKTKTEVNKKIAAYKETSEKGELFETVADLWWAEHEPTISVTSSKSYFVPLQRSEDYFSGKYIKDLKPIDLVRFMSAITSNYHLAHKTACMHLTVLRSIFQFALVNNFIDINIARDIEVPKNLKRTIRKMPCSEDIQRIKDNVNHPFGLFAYMALFTGCRQGELRALAWEDIDFNAHTITINKSVYSDHNNSKLKKPKTENSIRTIPLLKKLDEVLPRNKRGIVFSEHGTYIKEKRFYTLWNEYCNDTGVKCTVHQLRHAFATMLYENDIDVKSAQSILGHAQSTTTQDIYTEIRKTRENIINERIRNADIV